MSTTPLLPCPRMLHQASNRELASLLRVGGEGEPNMPASTGALGYDVLALALVERFLQAGDGSRVASQLEEILPGCTWIGCVGGGCLPTGDQVSGTAPGAVKVIVHRSVTRCGCCS